MVKKDVLKAICWLTIGRIDCDNKELDESYKVMVKELESVLNEMEKHDRKNAKLTILPWDEDED